ncbi:MAG: UDP-N-acetylmuramate dehydrogenase [Bacteroidetes bacterium]|nr:UDP-N-acetylmuramate dehydrogenase [Bacteroidota bacterium]
MEFHKNYSLKPFNSFGIDVEAEAFIEVNRIDDLREILLKYRGRKKYILGGGSNVLFTKDFDGLVIRNNIKGIKIERDYKNLCWVSAMGGENWHDFVLWSLQRKLGGLENLSLIPGTVGAAPIQNIGAYGVELKDVFIHLEAMDLSTGNVHIFKKDECEFGYRSSVFKNSEKGKFFITKVFFRLSQNPSIHVKYGAIQTTLKEMGIDNPGIEDVSNAVIKIRESKLPDPEKIGNAGSFFKNPEISIGTFDRIKALYPEMPHYPLPNDRVKIPAGWLIEKCGWKGKRIGDAGCHIRQALILVNYGNASGQEIISFSKTIQKSVKEKFGIQLSREVNMV